MEHKNKKHTNSEPLKVVCAIIENNGKILVVQRSETMKLALKWEFPGGKIEENETEIESLKREINEELHIEINPTTRLAPSIHHYPNLSIKLIPFVAQLISGELKLIEHKQALWLSKSELHTLDWAEADIPIVKEYINYE